MQYRNVENVLPLLRQLHDSIERLLQETTIQRDERAAQFPGDVVARENWKDWYGVAHGKLSGTVRRQSMELTRALTEMRRP